MSENGVGSRRLLLATAFMVSSLQLRTAYNVVLHRVGSDICHIDKESRRCLQRIGAAFEFARGKVATR